MSDPAIYWSLLMQSTRSHFTFSHATYCMVFASFSLTEFIARRTSGLTVCNKKTDQQIDARTQSKENALNVSKQLIV